MSKRVASAAFVGDACIQSENKRSDIFFVISHTTARNSCDGRERSLTASAGNRSCECPTLFFFDVCSSVSTVSFYYVSISGFLYLVRNEGSVAFCRMRSGLIAISVTFWLLPVSRVVRLSLMVFIYLLDVELIDKCGIIVKLLCSPREFQIWRLIKDYGKIVTIMEQAPVPKV